MLARALAGLTALIALLLASGPAAAAPQDAVMNKEGYWGVDIDGGACAASMTLQGGSVFLLRAVDGGVTLGLFARTPLVRGKAGRIETEAYGVDFQPSYGEDATTLYYDGDLDARALAALRLARQVRILTDGRMVAAMTFEGTGFEGALDAVIACSKGQSGWWGKGVVADGEPSVDDRFVTHKDGVWGILSKDGACLAQAQAPDAHVLQLLSVSGRIGLAVSSDAPMPRGRKVRVETDSYRFEFKAEYDKDARYVNSADLLDSSDTFALRRAKSMRLTVDGRDIVEVDLGAGTFAEIVDAVTACSRGEAGWWGEGAKPQA